MAAMWYRLCQEKEKSKTFTGHLSHSKQGTVYFCVLLSDLHLYQNLVSKVFSNNREGKHAHRIVK